MTLSIYPQAPSTKDTSVFLSALLDTLSHQLVVIDKIGQIQFVNKRWCLFGENNGCTIQDWSTVNYLEQCDKAAKQGDEYGQRVSKGIREVIEGKKSSFYLEYPCKTDKEILWFMMWVNPFAANDETYYVVSHHDITKRKKAEDEVLALSKLDPLTEMPNRRALNDFLQNEWKRCARLKQPLSYAILDIDHFKLINDTYGHNKGDEYLCTIAGVIKSFINRPGDMSGRYGGEEFAMIWGQTNLDEARLLSHKLMKKINALGLINEQSPVKPSVTVSMGLATIIPSREDEPLTLIEKADQLLYNAKKTGRNRIEF